MSSKILLINPNIGKKKYFAPLNLAYLKSVLDENDFESSILSIFDYEHKKITNAIKQEDPDIIGISCFTNERSLSFKVARLAKSINPDVKIVMGGHHATPMYEQILENYPVDYIVIGEGERTIVDLVNVLKNNGNLSEVKGIAYKNNNKIVKTEPQPLIQDLDSIPFPNWDGFDLSTYAPHDAFKEYGKLRRAPIVTSRGCPNMCQFCSTSSFWGGKWRYRSANNVVDELEIIHNKYKVDYVGVTDCNFTTHKKRVIEICKEIINRKIDIVWAAESRVDRADKEMLKWMKKAGCHIILYGVESGSSLILKTINKNITVPQIIEAFKNTKETGISARASLMVGNPNESEKTVNETINLIKTIKPDNIAIHITSIYPATSLYELAKLKGLIDDSYWLSDNPAPYYTEVPLEKLQYWQSKIYYEFTKMQGTRYMLQRILKNVLHPGRLYSFGRDFIKEKLE